MSTFTFLAIIAGLTKSWISLIAFSSCCSGLSVETRRSFESSQSILSGASIKSCCSNITIHSWESG